MLLVLRCAARFTLLLLVEYTLQCCSITPGAAANRTRFCAPERRRERVCSPSPSDQISTSSNSSRSESGNELLRFTELSDASEGRGISAGGGVKFSAVVGVDGAEGVDKVGITAVSMAASCRREGRGGRGGARRCLGERAYGLDGSDRVELEGLVGLSAGSERYPSEFGGVDAGVRISVSELASLASVRSTSASSASSTSGSSGEVGDIDSVRAHGAPYSASLRLAAVMPLPSACNELRPRASCGHHLLSPTEAPMDRRSPVDSARPRLSSLNTGRSGNDHASGEYGRYCQMFDSALPVLAPLSDRTRPRRLERSRRRGNVAYVSVNSAPRHHSFAAVSFHSSCPLAPIL